MFLNKFLLIGSGIAVAGTGTGLGVYYGVSGQNKTENKETNEEKPKKVLEGDDEQLKEVQA